MLTPGLRVRGSFAMISKTVLKKLDEYLTKYEGPWLTEPIDEEDDVPTLGGYCDSKSNDSERIALEAFLKNKEIFSKILMEALHIFDTKKGISHKFSYIYKKAYVSKQVFHSVFHGCIPSKDTVLQFAFALESSVEEAESLLKFAGYSFGDCVKRDLILKFCFMNKMMELLEVNELLKHESERPFLKDSRAKPNDCIKQMTRMYNRKKKGKNLVVLQ